MKPILYDNIPCEISAQRAAKRFHVKPDSDLFLELENLINRCNEIAKPKAIFTTAFLEGTNENNTIISGVVFTSAVMVKNLSSVHKVYPYIASCGWEIEDFGKTLTDFMETWWIDGLKEMYLAKAMVYLNKKMIEFASVKKFSRMNPGSIPDWPITQQPKLFELIDSINELTGVVLTESMLMQPTKSVSGIAFSSQSDYSNCDLCLNKTCPNRSTPFDQSKYDEIIK